MTGRYHGGDDAAEGKITSPSKSARLRGDDGDGDGGGDAAAEQMLKPKTAEPGTGQ